MYCCRVLHRLIWDCEYENRSLSGPLTVSGVRRVKVVLFWLFFQAATDLLVWDPEGA